jgi:anti-sigma-K factor RskA
VEPLSVHELTAAYALDALEADDARAYEAHLRDCERCREELAVLREGADALAWGVESPEPPARLRASILDTAAAERGNVVPLVRRPRLYRATAAAAAVAACAAVGLGIWAAVLRHELDRARSARTSAAGAAQILADRSTRRVSLTGGDGVVAVDPAGRAVLVVRALPSAPAGKTYEAWVIPHGGAPKRAGIFSGGDGTTVLRLGADVERGSVVAATLERSGGVAAPTRTPLFSARV